MYPSSSTITSKGQVTIPKVIRDNLELNTGDRVEFICNQNHEIVIKPVTKKANEVVGILSQYKKEQAVSVDEMNAGIQQWIKSKYVCMKALDTNVLVRF